jgi:hypothetical protein
LAIHYEHQAHQPNRAAALIRKALTELRPSNRSAGLTTAVIRRYRADFERRLRRLDRRTSLDCRAAGGLLDTIDSESRAGD